MLIHKSLNRLLSISKERLSHSWWLAIISMDKKKRRSRAFLLEDCLLYC